MQPLCGTIERFERSGAIVTLETKQSVVIPKRYLPKKSVEGSVLEFEIYLQVDAAKRKANIGRLLLEEILRPHDQDDRAKE